MSESTVTVKKRRVFIHRQAREITKNVIERCFDDRQNNYHTFPLNNALDRASYYTGLSKRSLSRINSEAKQGSLRTPSKKGKLCNKNTNLNVDDINRDLIHWMIVEFYLTKKIVPTSTNLLAALREKINFPWGRSSLRKLLKMMGYKWQKCHSKRRVLVERPSIVFARTNYLRRIHQYRQEDRNIYFVGEMWIDNNLTYKKCWRIEATEAVTDANRLILIHAGSQTGFLNGAKLLFKAGKTTEDYHDQMKLNFKKWTTDMLIPSLPNNSVIIMDNAPYHSVQENKAPKKCSTKQAMLEWLTKNSIEASPSMRKDQLFSLIESHRPRENIFKIDELIRSHGHIVLRLPPYMGDLNPMELAWVKIKLLIRDQNVHSDLSLSLVKLTEITDQALSKVTAQDWREYDGHVKQLEDNYWQTDAVTEDTVDRFVIEISGSEDSDTDSTMSLLSDSDDDPLMMA